MKITESTVDMSSERKAAQVSAASYTSLLFWEKDTEGKKAGKEDSARVSISEEAQQGLAENIEKARAEQQDQLRDRLAANIVRHPAQTSFKGSEEDIEINILKRLMETIRAMREGRRPDYRNIGEERSAGMNITGSGSQSFGFALMSTQGNLAAAGRTAGEPGSYTRVSVLSSFRAETETTAFSTVGVAKTADGREISFNVTMEMSRSFAERIDIFREEKNVIYCDPLVINLDGNPAQVRDQTYFFDLDADGREEELSMLAGSSGYLALDKNGDGKINDGSELFGTTSGDGFKDLAAYDEDGNGWIDEGDSIFKDLKVWTKDENGEDRLVGAGFAGIGAVYLGKADTLFHLNDSTTNENRAVIRSTGVFLKEDGSAGTIQHIDYAI